MLSPQKWYKFIGFDPFPHEKLWCEWSMWSIVYGFDMTNGSFSWSGTFPSEHLRSPSRIWGHDMPWSTPWQTLWLDLNLKIYPQKCPIYIYYCIYIILYIYIQISSYLGPSSGDPLKGHRYAVRESICPRGMVGAIDRPAKDQQQADESQDHAHDQDHLDRRVSWRKPTAQHRTKKSTRRTFVGKKGVARGRFQKGSLWKAFQVPKWRLARSYQNLCNMHQNAVCYLQRDLTEENKEQNKQ